MAAGEHQFGGAPSECLAEELGCDARQTCDGRSVRDANVVQSVDAKRLVHDFTHRARVCRVVVWTHRLPNVVRDGTVGVGRGARQDLAQTEWIQRRLSCDCAVEFDRVDERLDVTLIGQVAGVEEG